MTDEDLEEYLPKKGDRFALKDYLAEGRNKAKSNKASLIDRLKQRLQCNNTNTETAEPLKKIQKLSAKKEVHKVHLGWYHFDEKKKMYVQVREKAGGGKRTLMINKSMDKRSIVQECMDLFYPNGTSTHGALKDMQTELTDFQLKPLDDEDTTLGDIIDKAKLQFIHFYLRTRIRKQTSADVNDNGDERQKEKEQTQKSSADSKLPADVNDNGDERQRVEEQTQKSSADSKLPADVKDNGDKRQKEEEQTQKSSADSKLPVSCNSNKQSTESNDKKQETTKDAEKHNHNPEEGTSKPPDKADEKLEGIKDYGFIDLVSNDAHYTLDSADADTSIPLFFPAWEDSFHEIAFTHTQPMSIPDRLPKAFEIVVHRGQVLRELIKLFKDNSDIDFKKDTITASIILPNGEKEQAYDSGGVLRDLLTEFWDDFYEQCTTGTNLKIPCLCHDMEAADWKAVGRIIALGWILQKILPIRIAPNFLRSSMFGIAGDRIREEFLDFIPNSESRLIANALRNFEEVDMDDLIETLSNHECKIKITNQNLGATIDQIAHMEMIQEPAFIRECLFEVLLSYELVMDVEEEFKKITPTSKKIISSLHCEEPESDSFKHLKRYIREIDTDTRMLRNCLRFLTGSDLMLYNSEGFFQNTCQTS